MNREINSYILADLSVETVVCKSALNLKGGTRNNSHSFLL